MLKYSVAENRKKRLFDMSKVSFIFRWIDISVPLVFFKKRWGCAFRGRWAY